jgi:hypothetical protein
LFNVATTDLIASNIFNSNKNNNVLLDFIGLNNVKNVEQINFEKYNNIKLDINIEKINNLGFGITHNEIKLYIEKADSSLLSYEKKEKIREWLDNNVERFLPLLKDVRDINIKKDLIKSAILYNYMSLESDSIDIFNYEKNINKKIEKTIALLFSIAKMETGSFEYDLFIWSPTKAWGRYQINATTGQEAFLYAHKHKNINITNIRVSIEDKNELDKMNYEEYINKLKKKIDIAKDVNGLSIKQKDKENLKYFSNLFLINTKKTKDKLFTIKESIQIISNKEILYKYITLFKDPIFQGIIALKVIENKVLFYDNKVKKNNNELKRTEKEHLERYLTKIYKTYNADKKMITHKGKIMSIADRFSQRGKEIFFNIYSII